MREIGGRSSGEELIICIASVYTLLLSFCFSSFHSRTLWWISQASNNFLYASVFAAGKGNVLNSIAHMDTPVENTSCDDLACIRVCVNNSGAMYASFPCVQRSLLILELSPKSHSLTRKGQRLYSSIFSSETSQ